MKHKKMMIAITIIIIAIVGFFIFFHQQQQQCKTGCTDLLLQKAEELKAGMYQTITPKEVKDKIKKKEEMELIDVRTQQEYEQGHIETSKLMPLDTLEKKSQEELVDRNKEIIVYCRSGVRSKQAAQILINKGYTNVKDLGGIQDWPYEIVKE